MTAMTATSSAAAETTARGPVSRVHAAWDGERRYHVGRPGGTTIAIDAEGGPGPVDTLLGAVATCSAIDIVDILAKRRTPVERLEVEVAGERRAEAPRRLVHLAIEYRVDGAGIEREHAERAVQLSFEKYCSVAASLAPDIVAETTLVLNGERGAAVRQQVWTRER